MKRQESNNKKMIYAALCLALAVLLPMITGQIPKVGNMLCPMHFPVIICGVLCGWKYGGIVGLIAPLLKSALFGGYPPIMPKGISMSLELATYGIVMGLLYLHLNKTRLNLYISLITAMIAGRIVWGVMRYLLAGAMGTDFPFSAFIAGAITTAIPGIILQIVLIPIVIMALEKNGVCS